MNLNRQIAKIDGFVNIRKVGNDQYGYVLVGDKMYGEHARSTQDIPDYRAPENLHELVRVCLENDLSFDIDNSANDMATITVGKGEKEALRFIYDATVGQISAALAGAIVESAK